MVTPDALYKEFEKFESAISYTYKDRNKGILALIHSSYANENPDWSAGSNERLEFMGDALLDFVYSVRLFQEHPDWPEGDMSRIRAQVVCETSLAHVAERIGLGRWLLMGRGEDRNGGRERPSILADAVEAVFGSVYLDGGMEPATKMVLSLMDESYQLAVSGDVDRDWKTKLQEHLQKQGMVSIAYRITNTSGPDHARLFTVEVSCDRRVLGQGEGRSKKEAEQAAARQALETLAVKPVQEGCRG